MRYFSLEHKKWFRAGTIFVFLIVCGFALGWFAHPGSVVQRFNQIREKSSGYKLINPLLLIQIPNEDTSPEFTSLKNKINEYANTALTEKNATGISVYFRELNSNRWISVNGDQKYSPASMLKIASLIAFLRATEVNPSLLSAWVTISPGSLDSGSGQDYYKPKDPVKLGKTYSAQDLLSRMVIDSDNNAAAAIDALTGKELIKKTFTDLNLPIPAFSSESVDSISPRQYSRFFRTLYNGTYLSHDLSEQTLELLTKTTFDQGLVAGVPAGITVAHKFGERTEMPTDNFGGSSGAPIRELHDCGVVYLPANPYLVCIMTKGTDFLNLQKIIKEISSIAWDNAQSFNKK